MRDPKRAQVTLPAAVRERPGMLPKTEVECIVDGTRGESRGLRVLRALRGSATVSMSTEEMLALTRGE